MGSTFFGLTIAGSGLSAYQTAINVTANNVSNVRTEGYTRQEIAQTAAEALRANTKYGMIGSGTEVTDINQVRDRYYDIKFWNNNSRLGEYDSKYSYLKQIEAAFQDDDSITGFSTIFNSLNSSLESLLTNPSDDAYRNQFINNAQSLCDYFKQTANTLSNIQKDANLSIYAKVQEVNSIANEISLLNQQINTTELQGGHANELRDQRALLLDKLSAIVPIETSETDVINSKDPDYHTGATIFRVTINGHILVDNFKYNSIDCVARQYTVNQNDLLGLYDLRWSNDQSNINMASSAMTGELKALYDIRDGNNAENFSGKVTEIKDEKGIDPKTGEVFTYSVITIGKPSQKTVEELTLGQEGRILIDNKYFYYDSFKLNGDGSVELSLTEKIQVHNMYQGQVASVGESINFKGIPYYMEQLNEFVRRFSKAVNNVHTEGVDAKGNPAGLFYTGLDTTAGADMKLDQPVTSSSDSLYRLTAFNFKVSSELFDHPECLSTSDDITKGKEYNNIAKKMQQVFNDDKTIFRGSTSALFLETVLSDIAIDTNKLKTFSENYVDIVRAIDKQRASISGVDEDEEAMALVKFQNAYNLSSRIMQCMSEIYDRLITQTGV